jgi:hypothetical protein
LYEEDIDFPKLRTADIDCPHVQSVIDDKSLVPVYGVRGDCCFKDLDSFNVMTHLPQDCMHDLLEGVVPKSLFVILKSLFQRQILIQKDFDDRLLRFKFGSNDY